jgi:hypothetical protein
VGVGSVTEDEGRACRAAIEERYAKELMRLGKLPLADAEDGYLHMHALYTHISAHAHTIHTTGGVRVSTDMGGRVGGRTTKDAWATVKGDAIKQAEAHAGLAKELQEHVERPLLDYREQQKLKRKDVRRRPHGPTCAPCVPDPSRPRQTEATIAKDRRNMAVREADVERVRRALVSQNRPYRGGP